MFAALYLSEVVLKLYKTIPTGNVGDEFRTEVLKESSDTSVLKKAGFEFAMSVGAGDVVWSYGPLTGDRIESSAAKWFMYLQENVVLTINE